jgi:hypothetical protein
MKSAVVWEFYMKVRQFLKKRLNKGSENVKIVILPSVKV